MLQKIDKHTAAILELAEFFEKLDPRLYTQASFVVDGDRRCICGWCNHRTGHIESDTHAAAQTLGITEQQRNQLFAGNGGRRRNDYGNPEGDVPTPKDAARVLRHLAITGEIESDW